MSGGDKYCLRQIRTFGRGELRATVTEEYLEPTGGNKPLRFRGKGKSSARDTGTRKVQDLATIMEDGMT